MKPTAAFALSLLLVASRAADSFASPASTSVACPEEVVRNVLERDSGVALANLRLETARADAAGARALLPSNPYLGTNLSQSRLSVPNSTPGQVGSTRQSFGPTVAVFGEQEFELAGQRGVRIETADFATASAEASLLHAQRSAVAAARTAWVAYASAVAQHELARESVHWEEEGRRSLQSTAAGRSSLATADQDARIATAKRNLNRNALALAAARNELIRITGIVPPTEVPMPEILRTPPATPEDLLDEARAQRADLGASRDARRSTESALELARRSRVPNVSISGFFSTSDGDDQYGGGVSFPIPMFQSASREIRTAAADLTKVESDVRRLEALLEFEVREAHAAVIAALEDLKLIEETIRPRRRRIVALMDADYDRNEATASQLVNANLDLIDVESDHTNALATLARAWIELDRAVGRPHSIEAGVADR